MAASRTGTASLRVRMVAFMRSGPGHGVTMNPRTFQPRGVRIRVRAVVVTRAAGRGVVRVPVRARLVTLAGGAVVGLGQAPASAADRTEVDAATQQVERGAGQI